MVVTIAVRTMKRRIFVHIRSETDGGEVLLGMGSAERMRKRGMNLGRRRGFGSEAVRPRGHGSRAVGREQRGAGTWRRVDDLGRISDRGVGEVVVVVSMIKEIVDPGNGRGRT